MKVEPQRLKKFILDAGLIDEKEFTKALEKSEKTNQEIGKILISDGLIKEKELIKIEAYLLGIPFINLENETIPPDILRMIPESIARAHNIIAFSKKNNN